MTGSSLTPPPSPELFFETANAYQRPAALKAAIELDVFTAVAEGRTSVPELAKRCQASYRGVRTLCDYLVVLGFLAKEDACYRLTRDSAVFLDRRSPAYIGSALEFLLSPMLTDHFHDLTAVVRRGGTATQDESIVSPDNRVWVAFARAMAPFIASSADAIAELLEARSGRDCRILDIAAGHGLFGLAIARHNPNANVTAVDWPAVLDVAFDNARAAGVADRFSVVPGDAFEVDLGSEYDIVLLTNFLHHYDTATCEQLLRRVHAALKDDGRVATLEFVPNPDRVSPPLPAAFSLMMLAATAGGDAYTFAELESMFHDSGFTRSALHEIPNSIQQVVISYKK